MTRRIKLFEHARGDIWIWEKPVPGAEYIIGGDIALGRGVLDKRSKADQCAGVISRRYGWGVEQVGEFVVNMEVGAFGEMVAAIGFWFNEAWINLERNMVEGAKVAMEHMGYPVEKFYIPPELMSVMGQQQTRYFFFTSRNTKKVLVDTFIDYVEHDRVRIKSQRAKQEISTLQKDEKSITVLSGKDVSVAHMMVVIADSTLPPPPEFVPVSRRDIPVPAGVDPAAWRSMMGIEVEKKRVDHDGIPEWEEQRPGVVTTD